MSLTIQSFLPFN